MKILSIYPLYFLFFFLYISFNQPVSGKDTGNENLIRRYSKSYFNDDEGIRIDSIRIRRNWRTRDRIILQELEISPGDILTKERIDRAISRLWNIGNFSRVSYQIDTLKDKRILLSITAQDAVTIMPDLSLKGNRKEYLITAGISDNNFLGRNIDLGVAGSFGTNARYANLKVGIPRQLLFRNMTIRGSFNYGASQQIKYAEGKPVSGVAYMQRSVNLSVGNPWHTDYTYTFSPDFSIGYFSHAADTSLLTVNVPFGENFNAEYITISTGESIGLINRVRHQEDGYNIYLGAGYGISLNSLNRGYFSAGAGGRYAKLINRLFQFDASFSAGYTTTDLPSLISYLGPEHVKGITTGERWGNLIWSANTGIRLTYINREWIAIVQSFFINAGNALTLPSGSTRETPLFSAGTGLRVMIPFVPWLGVNLYYAYRGDSRHWYSMEF